MKRGFLVLLAVGVCAFCAAPAMASTSAPPTSCADVAAANPAVSDGNYTIYPNGQTFTVYCADMSATPKEYLTLQNTNNANFSTDVDSSDESVVTKFTRVRLDPATLRVDITDSRFSTTSGYVNYNAHYGPEEYAVASGCLGPAASSNVDLTGTPFYVNDSFDAQGWYPWGGANFSSNNQVVDIYGTGSCGDEEPSGHSYLQLGYTGTTYSAAPVITATVAGTMGANGWYTSPVTVTWSSDQPGIESDGCGQQTLTTATTGTTLTCSMSGPGGVSSQSVTIKLDTPSGLKSLVGQFSSDPSVSDGLGSKIDAIAQAPNGNSKAGSVRAFINQVHAQTGKALTADQASTLIALVQEL
ncbi:MAG TPA: GON domain-containing protein [Solirubrobacteraceae bacterium]